MILLGIGGGLGAVTRYLLGMWIGKRQKGSFPLGTFLINISGSLLLGVLAKQYDYYYLPEWVWLFVGSGFFGGYTTFSTFGNDSITLFLNKKYQSAVIYVVSTACLAILGAWIGYVIG